MQTQTETTMTTTPKRTELPSLRHYRTALTMTQRAMAAAADCNIRYLYAVEAGGAIDVEIAKCWARALGVSIELLQEPRPIERVGRGRPTDQTADGPIRRAVGTYGLDTVAGLLAGGESIPNKGGCSGAIRRAIRRWGRDAVAAALETYQKDLSDEGEE